MDKTVAYADKVAIIGQNGGRPESILNILLALQAACDQGYVDQETMALVAHELNMTQTRVFEIASFYSMINTVPQAKYVLGMCGSTPCFFSGATDLAGWLAAELQVGPGEITADGMFSYESVSCFGACDVGPALKVGDVVYGHLDAAKTKQLIDQLRDRKGRDASERPQDV